MKIAVVGAGGAGLCCAWLLRNDAQVTLLERDPVLGGHACSLAIEVEGATVHAETGFKYLTLPSHQRTMAWLALHGVTVRSFHSNISVTWEAEGETFVLPPRRAHHFLRLARNPRKVPYFAGMAAFKWLVRDVLAEERWAPTLASYTHPLLPKDFVSGFLQPFFASNWGASSQVIGGFPIYDVARVLPKAAAAVAYDVRGGTSAYVAAVRAGLARCEVRTACPVTGLRPVDGGVEVTSASGVEVFERVILALPAQNAAPLLGAWPEWQAVLGQVRTFPAHIVIHSDPSYMPADRRDWCIINQFHRGGEAFGTEWCGWLERRPVFRTWLPAGRPMPKNVHAVRRFEHLIVTPESLAMQRTIAALQGTSGLYAAGMYVTEVDIHESALASALDVAASVAPGSTAVRDYRAAIAEGRMPAIEVH